MGHRHVRAGFRFGNQSAQSLGQLRQQLVVPGDLGGETAESVAQDQIVRRGLIGPPSFAFVCEELELGGERAPAVFDQAPQLLFGQLVAHRHGQIDRVGPQSHLTERL